MESYVRPGLLLISVGALLFVVFTLVEDWYRRRRDTRAVQKMLQDTEQFDFTLGVEEKAAPVNTVEQNKTPPAHQGRDELLVLSVMAKPGQYFGSYDLLQAITAAGLKYGDMNIFHYYLDNTENKEPLFSLASVAEPGEFAMDQMGDFSCPGLVLFMQPALLDQPEMAFDLMLETANQLAEDLGGDLRADPKTPWNAETAHRYQALILKSRRAAVMEK